MLINLSEKGKKVKLYAVNKKTKERVRVTSVDFESKECFIKIPLEEKNGVKYNVPEWQKYSHRFDWELFMEITGAKNIEVIEAIEQQIKNSINLNNDEIRGAFIVINRIKELI